jgi:hypothetical protein
MMIFPTSPVWADVSRSPLWNEEVTHYDSGAYQGSTSRVRPLYLYEINGRNFEINKASSLEAFFNALKGRVTPFLFKDPYAYATSSAITQPSTTTMGNGSGFYLVEANSWKVIPDSAFLSIACGRSGALTAGVHYTASLDNGWIKTNVAPSSVWTASFQYFRKAVWDSAFSPGSDLWNNFHVGFSIKEILPS